MPHPKNDHAKLDEKKGWPDISSPMLQTAVPLTVKEKLIEMLRTSPHQVFLRSDFEYLGNYRQVSRILRDLEGAGELLRCGHGLFRRKALVLSDSELLTAIKSRLGKRLDRVVSLNDSLMHIKPAGSRQRPNKQTQLDEKKLRRAQHLLDTVPLPEIRRVSLATLERWRRQGTWCSAYGEWEALMRNGSDLDVVAAMTGLDENANRLRQSPPYAGFNHLFGEVLNGNE